MKYKYFIRNGRKCIERKCVEKWDYAVIVSCMRREMNEDTSKALLEVYDANHEMYKQMNELIWI